MVKFLAGELNAEDIINIASFNRSIRTAICPFGRDAYRSRYGGRAVPWKLLRKSPGESTSEYLARLGKVNSGVSSGLSSAIDMSKRHTEKGVAAVIYNDGSTGIMPLKAAIMGAEGRNRTVVEYTAFPNARAALPAIRAPVTIAA